MSARSPSCVLALLSSLVCALLAAPARADGIQVLFVAREPTPFSARVRAEIEAMGFELLSSDQLDEQGRLRAKAAAFVIETPPPRRVELWLQNPATGRLELTRVLESSPSDAAPGDEAAETVRASEQLRAFFQPLQPRAALQIPTPPVPRPAPPTRATAPPPAPIQPQRGRFFEELALALPIEPGSVGIDALIRGGGWIRPRWGIGGKLVIPLLSSTLHSGANSANVSLALAGAELSWLLVDAHAVRVVTRAGLALAWLRATGEASAPYTSRSDGSLAALPSLAAQLELPVSARVSLNLGAELGVAVPKFEVAFAGQPVANWARPFALLSAGVSLDL